MGFIRKNQKNLTALLLAAAVLIGFKFLGVLVYDTNDDAIMAGISYGYFGAPQGNLVYIHPLMGEMLAWLQRLVPGISWYYLAELGILFVSMAAFYSLLLDKKQGASALPSLAVLTLFFVYAILFRLQYTKIAGCAAAAGILLLYRAVEQKRKWGAYLLGILLALAGFCLRTDAFFMVLIPMAGVGVWYLIKYLKEKNRSCAGRLIGCFAVLFALCGCLMVQDKLIRDPAWEEYRIYNALRTELMDYGFPDYEGNRSLYESLGISEADLALYKSWDFGDPERFTIPVMQALCQAKPQKVTSAGKLLSSAKAALRGLVHYDFSACLLLACLLWLCCADKAGLALGIYQIVALFGTETYMMYAGRGLRERVDAPLILAVIGVLLLICSESEKKKNALSSGACAVLALSMVLSQCPGLMSRKDDAMERYVGAAHLHAAFQIVSRDKQTLYLTRTDELPADRMPGRQGGFGYYSNIGTLGGWLTESPYVEQRNASFGVTNPFRDMVDSDRVRLVSNDVQPVLDYIRRHYASNAQAVEVDRIRDEFSVWKITTG